MNDKIFLLTFIDVFDSTARILFVDTLENARRLEASLRRDGNIQGNSSIFEQVERIYG